MRLGAERPKTYRVADVRMTACLSLTIPTTYLQLNRRTSRELQPSHIRPTAPRPHADYTPTANHLRPSSTETPTSQHTTRTAAYLLELTYSGWQSTPSFPQNFRTMRCTHNTTTAIPTVIRSNPRPNPFLPPPPLTYVLTLEFYDCDPQPPGTYCRWIAAHVCL